MLTNVSRRLSVHQLEEREEPASDSTGRVRPHRGQGLRAGHLCRLDALAVFTRVAEESSCFPELVPDLNMALVDLS